MLSIKSSPLIFFLLMSLITSAQQPTIKILQSGKKISIRGLSVVNDDVIWASGSGGSVARSTDGGETFTWMKVPGYEKRDFRDIEAFDANTAIIMGVAEPAIILKTKDGGMSWTKVLEDTTKGMFLDAMDFYDSENGMVIGDPIKDYIYSAFTYDGGENWSASHKLDKVPVSDTGEAFFASSGTNIKMLPNGTIFVVSGGKASNIYDWLGLSNQPLPLLKGKNSTGANSIDFFESTQKGIIVGGDFTKDTINSGNCILFTYDKDSKKPFRFTEPQTVPHGYRSCVIYLDKTNLLTCGTSGIDISKDGGMNWELISKESFHVCQKAKKGKAVFLAGGNGRIAKLVYP